MARRCPYPAGMSQETNIILAADLTDRARAEGLDEWLSENAASHTGPGRHLWALTWAVRNLAADAGAVVRHVEQVPWAYPEFLQLLIQDQGDMFFRLWMFRAGRLVEVTPPQQKVQQEVWPTALEGIGGDLYLRTARADDARVLADMLVEAINWPPDRTWPRERILGDRRNAHYVSGWKRDTDLGVVVLGGPAPGEFNADDDDRGSPVGAAWLRYLPAEDAGYGFVDAAHTRVDDGALPTLAQTRHRSRLAAAAPFGRGRTRHRAHQPQRRAGQPRQGTLRIRRLCRRRCGCRWLAHDAAGKTLIRRSAGPPVRGPPADESAG
jgi:hypothetical protein